MEDPPDFLGFARAVASASLVFLVSGIMATSSPGSAIDSLRLRDIARSPCAGRVFSLSSALEADLCKGRVCKGEGGISTYTCLKRRTAEGVVSGRAIADAGGADGGKKERVNKRPTSIVASNWVTRPLRDFRVPPWEETKTFCLSTAPRELGRQTLFFILYGSCRSYQGPMARHLTLDDVLASNFLFISQSMGNP